MQFANDCMFNISHFFTIEEIMENIKWDKQYNTSFIDEVVFLKSKKIRYEWVYTNENGISVWKYKKTRELWLALAEMYSDVKYKS